MIDPAKQHPHLDGRPDLPHDHQYLFDFFQSQTVAAVPLLLVPIGLLIALQTASGLWHQIASQSFSNNGWATTPLTPPPRLSFLLLYCSRSLIAFISSPQRAQRVS
jgi:hypothetical protein